MRQLVVIGNGMVGHRLVEAVLDRDPEGTWQITVLGEETRPAYDRVALSSYFDGATETDLAMPDLSNTPNVELRLGERATGIDPATSTLTTSTGATLSYDALVLATGSYPFVPPVPGHDLDTCHVYRTIEDLDTIRATAQGPRTGVAAGQGPRTGVVIGGGLLGLEAANALRLLNLEAHVVEMAPWLMPRQVDEGGGALLSQLIAETGVQVHTGAALRAIETPDNGYTARVQLGGDTRIDADVVVFSVGIRPRDELARHVANYTDEWRGVLQDPDKLARFVSFANAPETPDPTITFATERDQPVPAGPVTLGMPTPPSTTGAAPTHQESLPQ